jgi:hypothetical protein
MRRNLRQALQLFGVSTHVDRQTLVDLIGANELEVLTKLGLLSPTTRRFQALCTSCDDEHLLPIRHDEDGKSFVACSKSVDRQYTNPDDCLGYSFNIRRFIVMFLEAEGFDPVKASVQSGDSILWEVGSVEITGTPQYLYFISGLNQIKNEYLQQVVKKNNPVLLYLADPSNIKDSIRVRTIPMLSVIDELDNDGITIDSSAEWTHFHQEHVIDGEDSIVLDKHIVLMKGAKELLFQNTGLGRFEGKISLHQPAVYMLEYLHNARTKDDPAVMLAVLADKFASGNKQTISTYKKEINDAAEKYGTKTVIGKDGRDRYRLNPRLDCCS